MQCNSACLFLSTFLIDLHYPTYKGNLSLFFKFQIVVSSCPALCEKRQMCISLCVNSIYQSQSHCRFNPFLRTHLDPMGTCVCVCCGSDLQKRKNEEKSSLGTYHCPLVIYIAGWNWRCIILLCQIILGYTHLKYNIAPENIPSQKETSLPTIIFQGLRAMLNFRGVTIPLTKASCFFTPKYWRKKKLRYRVLSSDAG